MTLLLRVRCSLTFGMPLQCSVHVECTEKLCRLAWSKVTWTSANAFRALWIWSLKVPSNRRQLVPSGTPVQTAIDGILGFSDPSRMCLLVEVKVRSLPVRVALLA